MIDASGGHRAIKRGTRARGERREGRRRCKKRDEDNANKEVVRARIPSYSRQNSFIISELKT